MFKLEKLSEFEKGSYKQKDGSPKNIAEIITRLNLLSDLVLDNHNRIITLESELTPEKEDYKKINEYKEQRKWIGHIVEHNGEEGNLYGILTAIKPERTTFIYEIDDGAYYACSIRLPDEKLFYKGHKDEELV